MNFFQKIFKFYIRVSVGNDAINNFKDIEIVNSHIFWKIIWNNCNKGTLSSHVMYDSNIHNHVFTKKVLALRPSMLVPPCSLHGSVILRERNRTIPITVKEGKLLSSPRTVLTKMFERF